ncbi:hypothetical protein HYE11_03345 [Mycoplasmopsis bovis]|nr:hypothetical protein HYE11_03345 [Mycoplasmopsis bovis]
MTSNIASNTELNEALDQIPSLKAELLKFLRPEFVNRIDEIVKFNQLREQDIQQIVILEPSKIN